MKDAYILVMPSPPSRVLRLSKGNVCETFKSERELLLVSCTIRCSFMKHLIHASLKKNMFSSATLGIN